VSVFWFPIIVGALIGKLGGGSLANVATLHVRYLPLLVVVAAVQVALVFLPPTPPERGLDPVRLALPLTAAVIGMVVLLNGRLPGMRLVLAGVAANMAVITANGGLMPISAAALEGAGRIVALELSDAHPGIRLPKSKDVLLPREETRLWWLSDVLVTPPIPRRKVVSPGDLLMGAGLGYLSAQAMLGRVRVSRVSEVSEWTRARTLASTVAGTIVGSVGKERVRGVAISGAAPAGSRLVA
jgi:hypothetical protein